MEINRLVTVRLSARLLHCLLQNYKCSVGAGRIFVGGTPAPLNQAGPPRHAHPERGPHPWRRPCSWGRWRDSARLLGVGCQGAASHVARGRGRGRAGYIARRPRAGPCERHADPLDPGLWAAASRWVRVTSAVRVHRGSAPRGLQAGRWRPRGGFRAPAGKGLSPGPALCNLAFVP